MWLRPSLRTMENARESCGRWLTAAKCSDAAKTAGSSSQQTTCVSGKSRLAPAVGGAGVARPGGEGDEGRAEHDQQQGDEPAPRPPGGEEAQQREEVQAQGAGDGALDAPPGDDHDRRERGPEQGPRRVPGVKV